MTGRKPLLTAHLAAILSGAIFFCLSTPLASHSQEFRITKLGVVKKPGEADGKAMATILQPVKVKGKAVEQEKTGSIGSHVLQAWPITYGHAALLLMSPEKAGQAHRLRYYQLDASKGRYLGTVPFATATMTESNAAVIAGPERWAFAVSGTDPVSHEPLVFSGFAFTF